MSFREAKSMSLSPLFPGLTGRSSGSSVCGLLIGVPLLALVSGCSRGSEAPHSQMTAAEMERSLQGGLVTTPLAPGYKCRVQGAIRDDGPSGLVWKTPGRVSFHLTIPCARQLDPKQLMVSIIADPDGEHVECGSCKPETVLQENGHIHLLVALDVLAAFETHGRIGLQIRHFTNAIPQTIAEVPLAARFE